MSGFSFGTPATTASSGFNFSATATPTGFGFGAAPPATTAPPSFGSTVTASPGFSFGTPAAAPIASAAAPLLNFSTPAGPTAPTPGFSFSTPAAATTASTGFSYGTSTAVSAAAPPPSFGLATTPQVAPQTGDKISFGTPAMTTTSAAPAMFATPASTAGISLLTPASSSAGLTFGATPAKTAGLSFGAPPTSSVPNFNVSATSTTLLAVPKTTAATGFSFGPATSAPTLTLGVTPAVSAAAAAPKGLGGVDVNAAQPKATEGKPESGKVKESQVPQEIIQTVESLKTYIKEQKSLSSDIARTSSRKMNIQPDIQNMVWNVQQTQNDVDANRTAVKVLRSDTGQVIQQVEMAQRTQETPAGLQFENTMPLQFFNELTQKYENDLMVLKSQVELTENHMLSLSNPQRLVPEDLKRGIQQIHESFIALAGRLYEIHQRVEVQKQHYLNLRKFLLNEKSGASLFGDEEDKSAVDGKDFGLVSAGPTPFSNLGNLSFNLNLTGASQQHTTMKEQTGTSSFFNLQPPPSSFGIKRTK